MENLATVAAQVGVLFALMGVGAGCRLSKLLDDRAVKGIVNVLVLVVTPCLVVDVFQRPFERSALGSLAAAFAVAAAAHAAAAVASRAFARGGADSQPVLRLSMVFSNAGFMGIPLEQAILGREGVFYGIAYVVVFNFFIWSWGVREMAKGSGRGAGGADRRKMLLQMAVNPGTAGIAAGLPLFLLSARLPEVLGAPVHMMAGLNTPLAMIAIGYYLAGADFRRVLSVPAAYAAAAVRLVAFPLALVGALWLLRGHLDRTMSIATAVAGSAPVAAMVTMFAAKFDRDVDLAAGLASATTLLSILTMPPIVALAMEVL